jgi:ribosomal protein S18 acetylase RimI-like enzyme
MFADLALARRIDEAEASLSADITNRIIARGAVPGAFHREFAGGVAVCAGPASPVNKIIGAGFDGVPDDGAFDELEARYFALGASARAEVATLADPAFAQHLTRRGYVLNGFENVLACPIAPVMRNSLEPPGNAMIEPASDQQAFMDVMIDGFESPDTGVVSAPGEQFARDVLEQTFNDIAGARGFVRYVAIVDGEVAAAGTMRLFDGVAQLCGAATRPLFRRRGLQTAMLHARLREAAAAGCDVAVVTTEPGSKSQQNVQRAGFALLYTRAVLIKQPPAYLS